MTMTINTINTELATRNLGFQLEEQHVSKPDASYDGIILRPNGDVSRAVCPTLHAEILNRFDNLDDCIEYLSRQFRDVPPFALDFLDCPLEELYSMIRPRIFPVDRIPDYTDCGVYAEEYNGFGLSYFIDLGADAGGNSTINLTEDLISLRGIDIDHLRTESFNNLADKVRFVNMNAMLAELVGADIPEPAEPNPMYVLTTTDGFEGASCIFCRTAMETVEEVLGNRFYILPSSRHEVICVSDGLGDPEALTAMVREVNATQVEDCDILGWHALIYDHGVITVAE